MSDTTKIEWTDATFNIAWGCEKVSPGCAHCYAERDSKRYGHAVWGKLAPRRVFGPKHWNDPIRWVRKWDAEGRGRPMRIFTSSMADVFEDHPTIATERAKLWPLIRATPSALWQIVTKRPENFARFLPDDWGAGYQNVILMVTAEDQPNADRRVPILLSTAAALRGVSYEPALGAVDWDEVFREIVIAREPDGHGTTAIRGGLDWIIIGGESGPGARPFDVAWARQTIAQCREAGTAVFVKQLGARATDVTAFSWRKERRTEAGNDEWNLRSPTGALAGTAWSNGVWHTWDENGIGGENAAERTLEDAKREVEGVVGYWGRHPMKLRDRKGGDWNEWSPDLRVREFPAVPR